MEKNKFFLNPNWELVEDFARKIYINDMAVLTKGDIKVIEKSIEEGASIYDNKDPDGEMNFLWNDVVDIITIGFMAIQIAIAYVSWKYPIKSDTILSSPSESNIESDKEQPDYVEMILSDPQYSKDLKTEIVVELQKNKEILNNLLYHITASYSQSKT